jgi:hypothetical protein
MKRVSSPTQQLSASMHFMRRREQKSGAFNKGRRREVGGKLANVSVGWVPHPESRPNK